MVQNNNSKNSLNIDKSHLNLFFFLCQNIMLKDIISSVSKMWYIKKNIYNFFFHAVLKKEKKKLKE